jgi:TonB-dependent starch-binding outer membrane protein SusC
MHNERFMGNLPIISQWKWRVSYGVVGSQAIDSYETLARLDPVLSVVNGVQVNAVRPSLMWPMIFSNGKPHPPPTWARTLAILANRVTLSMDYYRNITTDLLFLKSICLHIRASRPRLQNVGKVENKGFEFSVSSRNLTGMFQWNTDFNISFNRNKILELPGGKDRLYGNCSRPLAWVCVFAHHERRFTTGELLWVYLRWCLSNG